VRQLASKLWLILILGSLSACTTFKGEPYESYITRHGASVFEPAEFAHCHGYGCRLISHDALTTADRAALKKMFKKVKSAEAEREAVKGAIAWFETTVGARVGTSGDVRGTYRKLGNDQHDCVDESINTTIYLSLLKQLGHLKYHDIKTPHARFPIISGRLGPHQSAVIEESETTTEYVVDSWFHDNGAAPEIVTEREWFYGWRPQKDKS
jgi:hypothetical protein